LIRGIHHVALHTPNFDAMARFYREAFGFMPAVDEFHWRDSRETDAAIGVEGSAARTLMLKAENCYLEIFEYDSPPSREGGPARPNDYGYTHFCVDVTDIEEEFDRLAALGMTFPLPKPADFGPVQFIYGKDPDGNIIEIQQLDKDHGFALERLERLDLSR
jgi:catechol 2,3-dioxygenase-like lactoylglutathione lyase family enzyme